jgi:NTE family protein
VRAAGERALVLGGAGSVGNAWEIGVIAGLFEAGLDVTEADLTIGTSAGSTAAAQITSGIPTDRTACRHPCRCAPATDWSGRIRPWTCSDWAGVGSYGENERSHRCR